MRFILLLSLTLMLGCQTSNVAVDYDTQASFTNYKYYSWKETPVPEASSENKNEVSDDKSPETNKDAPQPPQPQIVRDPLISERVKKAVSTQLISSGFQPASASQPADVLIRQSVISKLRTEPPRSGASIGMGRSGRNTGVGLGFRFPLGRETIKRDIIIYVDLLDAKDEQLKWRGSKTLVFGDETPEQISTYIDAAVAEIFSFYPPNPN